MRSPSELPWVEQQDDLSSRRIDADQIWSLLPIAVPTSKAQIVRLVAAAVLARNHMLNVERSGKRGLGKPTILAAMTSSTADIVAMLAYPIGRKTCLALDCQYANSWPTLT